MALHENEAEIILSFVVSKLEGEEEGLRGGFKGIKINYGLVAASELELGGAGLTSDWMTPWS